MRASGQLVGETANAPVVWRLHEERLNKAIGVKWLQIVQAFADADEFDRKIERLPHADDCASLGSTVKLGEDHAGATNAFGEDLRLTNRVLAVSRVDHQQYFVRRTGIMRWITLRIFSSSLIKCA